MKKFLTKTRLVVIAGLVGVIGLVTMNLPAAATTETEHRFLYTPDQFNVCTGEIVVFTEGSAHLTIHVTDNGNGTFLARFHLRTQGVVGQGFETLDRYTYEEVDTVTEQVVPSGEAETTTYHKVVLNHHSGVISDETADDRHEHVRFTTRWSNGVPLPAPSNQIECR